MKAFLRYTAALLGAYFAAWTLSYCIVMYNAVKRLDFSEYVNWFLLAWTFRGFEMVAAAWALSIVVFLPLGGLAIFLTRRWGRRQSGEMAGGTLTR